MSYGGPTAPQIFLALIALGGAGYFGYTQFQASSLGVSAEAAAVYRRLGLDPLPNALAGAPKMKAAIETLAAEPCDKPAIFAFANGLTTAGRERQAAAALQGYAKDCPDPQGELYAATNILFGLGDYNGAVEIATRLIADRPQTSQYYFARAQAHGEAGRLDLATADYASALAMHQDLAKAGEGPFVALSRAFERGGRICEARSAAETYLAAAPPRRAKGALRRQIEKLEGAGGCAGTYAQGETVLRRNSKGVAIAKGAVNGVKGRFQVDPEAALTVLDPGFAKKAGVAADGPETAIPMGGAAARTRLASAGSVAVGEARSDAVAVGVSEQPIEGVDGVIGLSLLARYDLTIGERAMRLTARR